MRIREIEDSSALHMCGEEDVSLPQPWKGHHMILSREVEDHQEALVVVMAQVDKTGGTP